MKPDVLIAGIGNVLMGDDAFGPAVIEHLRARYDFPPGVKVADLGTPGVDLALHIAGVRALILVDAMADGSLAAGEWRVFTQDEIRGQPETGEADPHGLNLREALMLAETLDGVPEFVRLIAVAADSCTMGAEMSEPMKAAIGPVVRLVTDLLSVLELPVRSKSYAEVPDIWWSAT